MTRLQTNTREKPARVVNFTTIRPVLKQTELPGLLAPQERPGEVRLARAPHIYRGTSVALRVVARTPGRADLTPLATRELRVPRVTGLIGARTTGITELTLPYGTPRFVNAATLKRMLQAKPSDALLKRAGDRWDVCEDSLRIDLLDDAVEFRLGAVQIFS